MFISIDTLQDWIAVLDSYEIQTDGDGCRLYIDLDKIRGEMEEMVNFVLSGIGE
jgi:hypothetical protein